jgi:hypothetical protein
VCVFLVSSMHFLCGFLCVLMQQIFVQGVVFQVSLAGKLPNTYASFRKVSQGG